MIKQNLFLLSTSRSWALTSALKTKDLPRTNQSTTISKQPETKQSQTKLCNPNPSHLSVIMKLDGTHGDMSGWREIDFALNCTYIVPDQVSDPSFSLPKAMTSIPRNLTFEYGTDNEVRTDQLCHMVFLYRWTARTQNGYSSIVNQFCQIKAVVFTPK